MRPTCVSAVVGSWLAVTVLSNARAAPQSATSAPGESGPAVWVAYNRVIDLDNLPKRYACDVLADKIRDILLSLGAGAELKVLAYGCNGFSPRVHVQFSLPRRVALAKVGSVNLQAAPGTLLLEPGHPRSLDAEDCKLLRHIKDLLLPTLPLRVVSYRFTCIEPPSRHRRFKLLVQGLTPVSQGEPAATSQTQGR